MKWFFRLFVVVSIAVFCIAGCTVTSGKARKKNENKVSDVKKDPVKKVDGSIAEKVNHDKPKKEIPKDSKIDTLEKWIHFYTNINRVYHGRQPFIYDPVLAKAARWQSKYCTSIGTLNHSSTVSGMHDVGDRIAYFEGDRGNGWGENLTLVFTEKTIIKIAYEMLTSWMGSPGHRRNILSGFTWMGTGAAIGSYSGYEAYYGCQVFTYKSSGMWVRPDDEKKEKKMESLPVVKVTKGKEGDKAAYYITDLPDDSFAVQVLDVSRGDYVKEQVLEEKDGQYVYVKSTAPRGWLFLVLKHKETGMLYPVKMLQ